MYYLVVKMPPPQKKKRKKKKKRSSASDYKHRIRDTVEHRDPVVNTSLDDAGASTEALCVL